MNWFKPTIISTLLGAVAALGLPHTAQAQVGGVGRTVTNKTGMSFTITPYEDGFANLGRNKYAAWDASINRPYWYSQTGSANRGSGESGQWTSPQQWCRVRYLYNDDVRIPECWGSFMYSSDLITGMDGNHYELWFSPSSLSYYKVRNQETDTWYAHDGSDNAGHSGVYTSKDDWCDVIIYHLNGIVKIPKACHGRLDKILKVSAGFASPIEEAVEFDRLKATLALGEIAVGSLKVAKGSLTVSGSGFASGIVGVPVAFGTEAVKNELGLQAQDEHAGAIAAEAMTTSAVNAGVTSMIMTIAGASFNPVSVGVGVLVSGAAAGGEALYEASKDTGIVFELGYENHPRYNLDLNGIISYDMPHLELASKVDGELVGSFQVEAGITATDIADGWIISKVPERTGFTIMRQPETIEAAWVKIPGEAVRIGGSYEEPWVMQKSGGVFRYADGGWEPVPGKTAIDVGDGWIISNERLGKNFKIYRYNRTTKAWDNISGRAVKIGGTYDNPWVVQANGGVYEYINGWQHRPGITASDVGQGWAVAPSAPGDTSPDIFQYKRSTNSWTEAVGPASAVGGVITRPMIVGTDGVVYDFR